MWIQLLHDKRSVVSSFKSQGFTQPQDFFKYCIKFSCERLSCFQSSTSAPFTLSLSNNLLCSLLSELAADDWSIHYVVLSYFHHLIWPLHCWQQKNSSCYRHLLLLLLSVFFSQTPSFLLPSLFSWIRALKLKRGHIHSSAQANDRGHEAKAMIKHSCCGWTKKGIKKDWEKGGEEVKWSS